MWTIDHDLPLENHRSKNIVLHLQMTLVGFSCKAGATKLTVNATTLVVGGCFSWRFVFGILILCIGLAYPSRNADHEFPFSCICKQTNPFKQSNQDIKQLLQSNWVSRGKEPIVDVKRHQYFSHSVAAVQRLHQASDEATP
jgi:hypothetical protein